LFDRSDVFFGADNCGHILNKIEKVLTENHLADDIAMLKDIVTKEATRQLGNYYLSNSPKPSAIYHRFLPVKAMLPTRMVREIMLIQTLPYSELDTPDWVDAYTGEIDEGEFILAGMTIKDKIDLSGISNDDRYKEYFADHWTVEEYQTFLKAQDSFNGAWDEEENEGNFDDYDTMVFNYAEMQNDELPTSYANDARLELKPFIEKLHERRNEEFQFCTNQIEAKLAAREKAIKAAKKAHKFADLPKKSEISSLQWETCKFNIHNSLEMKELLETMGNMSFEPADVLSPVLHLLGDYGVWEKDLFEIKTNHVCQNLGAWFELHGDNLLEHRHDPIWSPRETDRVDIERFCDETLELYVHNIAMPNHKDVTRSPEYVRAYLREVFEADDITQSVAISKAWDGWREQLDPEGASAFRKAVASGKSKKEANAAFFKLYSRFNIVSTTSKELFLASPNPKAYVPTRKIAWNALPSLFKSGLIRVPAEKMDKLIAMLKERNIPVNGLV